MYNKTIIEFGFRMISWIIKTSCLYYLPQPSASADNTDLGFDNSWYHAQPHPITVYYYHLADADLFTRFDRYSNFVFHLPRKRVAGALSPVIFGRMGDNKFSWEDFFQSYTNLGGNCSARGASRLAGLYRSGALSEWNHLSYCACLKFVFKRWNALQLNIQKL